jgi:hypothetical protein
LLHFARGEGKGFNDKELYPIYPVKDYYMGNMTTEKLKEIGFQEHLSKLIFYIYKDSFSKLEKPVLRYEDDWFFSVLDDEKIIFRFKVMYLVDEVREEKELGEKLF